MVSKSPEAEGEGLTYIERIPLSPRGRCLSAYRQAAVSAILLYRSLWRTQSFTAKAKSYTTFRIQLKDINILQFYKKQKTAPHSSMFAERGHSLATRVQNVWLSTDLCVQIFFIYCCCCFFKEEKRKSR